MPRVKKMGRETLVVIRAPKVSPLFDDGPPPVETEHEIKFCSVLPRLASGAQASNEHDKGWTIVDGSMCIAPYGSDVLATDRIRFPDGLVAEVDGKAGVYKNRRGQGKGVIFYTKALRSA